MKIRDLSELAARNLRESILRNSLTTLGIAVGVASLAAMLSLGIGLQDMVNRRMGRTGLFDSVVVRPRTRLFGQGQSAGQRLLNNTTPGVPANPLDEAARSQLGRIASVVEVYPELRFAGDIRLGSEGRLAQVASLPASAASSDALEEIQGEFFSSPQAKEIILQLDLAQDLAGLQQLKPADLLGKQVTLRYAGRGTLPSSSDDSQDAAQSGEASPEEAALGFSIVSSEVALRVVGIVNAEAIPSGALGFGRAGAYLPVAVAEGLSVVQGNDMNEVLRSSTEGGGKRYNNLTVRVQGPTAVPAVEDAIRQMGYSAFSLLDVTRNLGRAFAVLDLLLAIFGSLALAVASLGIVNTLVMSILERRREIGVLKALGASDRDVSQLFFFEAGAMGLLGGVAGVGLGWTIGKIIQFATTLYLRRLGIPAEQIWVMPAWLVGGAILFSVLVSLAAGMYPASHAARLDPVEALRYE